MSRKSHSHRAAGARGYADVFAALGDETRLLLVGKLAAEGPHSISRLTAGSRLTRQAIRKHLRMMENAGIVHGARLGRETLFELTPEPILAGKRYLDLVSEQWDEALGRLKSLVER